MNQHVVKGFDKLSPNGLNEAPRSSLLRRSSHFGYEGRKLRGILRNSPKPLPSFAKAMEGSPCLHLRSKLRGIRRGRINRRFPSAVMNQRLRLR